MRWPLVSSLRQVCALQWSKHEREILSSHGFSQNQLCLWKYPSMVKMAELTGHTSRVLHLAQVGNFCLALISASTFLRIFLVGHHSSVSFFSHFSFDVRCSRSLTRLPYLILMLWYRVPMVIQWRRLLGTRLWGSGKYLVHLKPLDLRLKRGRRRWVVPYPAWPRFDKYLWNIILLAEWSLKRDNAFYSQVKMAELTGHTSQVIRFASGRHLPPCPKLQQAISG